MAAAAQCSFCLKTFDDRSEVRIDSQGLLAHVTCIESSTQPKASGAQPMTNASGHRRTASVVPSASAEAASSVPSSRFRQFLNFLRQLRSASANPRQDWPMAALPRRAAATDLLASTKPHLVRQGAVRDLTRHLSPAVAELLWDVYLNNPAAFQDAQNPIAVLQTAIPEGDRRRASLDSWLSGDSDVSEQSQASNPDQYPSEYNLLQLALAGRVPADGHVAGGYSAAQVTFARKIQASFAVAALRTQGSPVDQVNTLICNDNAVGLVQWASDPTRIQQLMDHRDFDKVFILLEDKGLVSGSSAPLISAELKMAVGFLVAQTVFHQNGYESD
jgi:hypothetical protein